MARYYSMTEVGEGTPVGAVTTTTTSTFYNSTYARSAVAMNTDGYLVSPPFVDASSATDIWVHGAVYGSDATANRTPLQLINSSGTVVFRIRCTTSAWSSLQAEYWNGSTYTAIGSTFIWSAGTLVTLDVHLVCGGAGNCTVYINKSSVATTASMSASTDNVASVRYGASSGTTPNMYWSQMAAASFDTRDLIIRTDPATGNGANTAWAQDYTAIDETTLDDMDLISSASSNQKETYTHTSFTIPSGTSIDSVWVAGRGRVNGAGPSDAYYILRSGGTDYDSSALSLGTGLEGRGRYWTTDPATSAKFNQAGYDAVQFGVRSA